MKILFNKSKATQFIRIKYSPLRAISKKCSPNDSVTLTDEEYNLVTVDNTQPISPEIWIVTHRDDIKPDTNEEVYSLIGSATIVFNAQTNTTYTIAATDRFVTLENALPITVTVENNATVPIPVGVCINVLQRGAGKVTFVGGVGVTINSKNSNKSINGQYVTVSLIKETTDSWYLIGDLVA